MILNLGPFVLRRMIIVRVRTPQLRRSHPFVFVEVQSAGWKSGLRYGTWDISRNLPLQTFFFVPSFMFFVLHTSVSFVPQLQQPSIPSIGPDLASGGGGPLGVGVGASPLSGDALLSTGCVKVRVPGGTALSRRNKTGF